MRFCQVRAYNPWIKCSLRDSGVLLLAKLLLTAELFFHVLCFFSFQKRNGISPV